MLPYRVLIGLDVRGIFMEWFLGSTLLSVCSFGAWENAHCFCHKSCFKTLADVSRIWNSVLPSRQWTDVNSILSTRTARPARFPQRTKCHDNDLEFGSIQVVMTKYQQHASLHFAWDGAYLMAELTAVGENGKISQGPCQPKLQDSTNRFPYFRKRNLFTFRASPQFASFQKPIHSIGRPHVPPELSALGLDTHVWSESSLSFHGEGWDRSDVRSSTPIYFEDIEEESDHADLVLHKRLTGMSAESDAKWWAWNIRSIAIPWKVVSRCIFWAFGGAIGNFTLLALALGTTSAFDQTAREICSKFSHGRTFSKRKKCHWIGPDIGFHSFAPLFGESGHAKISSWIVFAVWRWSDESDSQGHSSSPLQALPRLALQHNA